MANQAIAKPGPGRGNRRTGRTKGRRGQPGGAHQIAWDADPVILDRIRVGVQPWLERRSPAECLQVVNAFLKVRYPDEPPVGVDTLYADRQRAIELRKREAHDPVDEHLMEYDAVIAQSWQAFRDAGPASLNRGSYMKTISATIKQKSELDGTLKRAATLTVKGDPDAPVEVRVLQMSDEDIGATIRQGMEIVPGFRDLILGPRRPEHAKIVEGRAEPHSGPNGRTVLIEDATVDPDDDLTFDMEGEA